MNLLREIGSSALLFCLVFGMSATVEIKSLKKQIQNVRALGIGVGMQFFIMPFVGFCVVKIMKLPATAGVILLVITTSPGGSYSNWWCSLFNAELALSVTMTTISTLLSVVMLPINLVLYTKWTYSDDVVQSLDWVDLVVTLVVVISGIGGGLYSSSRAEKRGNKAQFHKTANRLGNIAGLLLVSLSVLVSSSDNGDSKSSLWDQDPKFYIGVALPAVIGLFISVKLATYFDLEPPERVAVAVEACYQNTGIATSVALALYSGDDLAIAIGVPLFYGMVEAFMLGCFCIVSWKLGWTKAPPSDNICKVILNSYEVEEEHEEGQGKVDGSNSTTTRTRIPTGTDDDNSGSMEMTAGAAVIHRSNGAVAVVAAGYDEEDEMPKVTAWQRWQATFRARAAGYGFGVQDEDKGLKISYGPETLGLSEVNSPELDPKRKKIKSTSPKAAKSSIEEGIAPSEDKGDADAKIPAGGKEMD